jgi:hypothetical protein
MEQQHEVSCHHSWFLHYPVRGSGKLPRLVIISSAIIIGLISLISSARFRAGTSSSAGGRV